MLLALAGCAGVGPPTPTMPVPPPLSTAMPPAPAQAPLSPEQRTATAAALSVEQQWLSSWFRGTPVRIAQRDDGTLTVDVPREFSFDPGRSVVKPALAAVLDKVAESLRRRPMSRLTSLAAPDDRPQTSPLAVERAVQVHRYLRQRGVPAARLGEPSATSAATVQLRIGPSPR